MAHGLSALCGKNEGMTSSLLEPPARLSLLPGMNFWWAIQSDNFPEVYPDGTLWAPLLGSSGQRVASWETLRNVRPGDLVFHYSRPAVRGVSRVATPPAPAYTPARGYREPEGTPGTLVLTEPVSEVHIAWAEVLHALPKGQGPLTTSGTLNRGYFYAVDSDGAQVLLQRAGINVTDDVDGVHHGASLVENHFAAPTDGWAVGAVRTEQRYLRKQQLQLRGNLCSLCGGSFPEEFLVAAHIKPRSACSEKERLDTRNVSMLACLFGCDALFELGYILVGESGMVEAGKTSSEQVRDRLKSLLGRQCLAYDARSRSYFEWHREAHSA